DALPREARDVYAALDLDSPMSTKQHKDAVGMKGRASEGAYNRATKQLWDKLLIVGYGEVDEGAFPSLAVGATRALFEELWTKSQKLSREDAWAAIRAKVPDGSTFIQKLAKQLAARSVQVAPG